MGCRHMRAWHRQVHEGADLRAHQEICQRRRGHAQDHSLCQWGVQP